MIVRNIKEDPSAVLKCFDWFNDYNDTRNWAVHNCDDTTVKNLYAGYKEWLKKTHENNAPTP